MSKIKIFLSICSLVVSVYLFVSPHTYIITNWDNVRRVQKVSLKDSFLHYLQDPQDEYGNVKGKLLGLPFLSIFFITILFIEPNSEKNNIRIAYIIQGIILLYFAWHIMEFKLAWIVLPFIPDENFYTVVSPKALLIQLLTFGTSILSFIKGIWYRLYI